jgi:hypothetical protein
MSITTKTFDYNFTDSRGNIFDITMTATSEDQTLYIVEEISGIVTTGSTSSAVTGLSGFGGAYNILSNTASGYSTSSYWGNQGVSFTTEDGTYYKFFYHASI